MSFKKKVFAKAHEIVSERLIAVRRVRATPRGARLLAMKFKNNAGKHSYATVWIPPDESVLSLGGGIDIKATDFAAKRMRAAIEARLDDIEPCRDAKGRFQSCL